MLRQLRYILHENHYLITDCKRRLIDIYGHAKGFEYEKLSKEVLERKCDYCDHLFNREADLNDHVGRFHAGVKKYVCFVCHKRFKRKQSLENHVLMIHGVSGSGATPGLNDKVTTHYTGTLIDGTEFVDFTKNEKLERKKP